eukprot:TRINITY_DN1549_c0_g1_i8.p1 TRINITY_DN1549_c0_g1~~TRINITY_DN1549_c0_g1_i8.p1  ORF type:complete len:468 (-),score=17.01 TRINITY_DN1549_c0_g1_i8:377-1687(-)
MRPRLSKIWKGGQHLHDKIYHPKRKYISSLTNLMWPVCQAAVVVFFFFVFLLSYLTIANKVGDNGIRRETSYVNEQNSEGLQNDKEYPRIAYVIMGGQGDSDRILRLLGRIYDQQNIYAIHYDNRAPDSEFQALKQEINTCDGMCRNVHLLPRYVAMPQDITMVDVEISGMAYLLNLSKDWEYVVGLSSSHYPLYPQSYIRGVLGMLPKHASMFKYYQAPCMKGTGNSVLVDGGETSQSTKRSGNLDVKRPLNPDYSYYVGSQWHVLSRKFAEYLVLSPDGLARRVLLYFANVAKPDEYYFQTVACSSKEHRKYVLNYTFHYDDRNKLLQDPDNKQHLENRMQRIGSALAPNHQSAGGRTHDAERFHAQETKKITNSFQQPAKEAKNHVLRISTTFYPGQREALCGPGQVKFGKVVNIYMTKYTIPKENTSLVLLT